MMMLKMMNPFGSVTDSIPGVGGGSNDDDSGETKEEQEEQERLRQEAIKQAERERRDKYKKQEEERETMRQTIRDKVRYVRFRSPDPCLTDSSICSSTASRNKSMRTRRKMRTMMTKGSVAVPKKPKPMMIQYSVSGP